VPARFLVEEKARLSEVEKVKVEHGEKLGRFSLHSIGIVIFTLEGQHFVKFCS